MIEFVNMSYHYEDKPALEKINLTIEKGQAVALIGQNGCGKSTLLKIMNGLIFPTSGKYLYKNQEISDKALKDIAFSKTFHQQVGFVFQNSEVQLFCSTVEEELSFGPKQMGLTKEEMTKRVEDILELLEIKDLRGSMPHHLSGGEMKRIAIGAALTMNPAILTLDEPLNSIDPKGKRFLVDIFKVLHEKGKTLVCATHDFDLMEGLFDRVIVFSKDHQVVADGSYKEIVSDRKLLEFHNII